MVKYLSVYDTAWYQPDGADNILSLRRAAETFHVLFDSCTDNQFVIQKEDGSVRKFTQGPKWLYQCNLIHAKGTIIANTNLNNTTTMTLPINIVSSNLERYTQLQVINTEITRQFQNNIGFTANGIFRLLIKTDSKLLIYTSIHQRYRCYLGPKYSQTIRKHDLHGIVPCLTP